MKNRMLWKIWLWIIHRLYNLYDCLLTSLGNHMWVERSIKFKKFFGMLYKNGEPKRCYVCGSTVFNEKVIDTIGGFVCEKESTCERCKAVNGYWAYGHWML